MRGDDADGRFVSDRFGPRASGIYLLGAGEWSRAYALVLDGRKMVIRFGGHVADFRKDQVMAAWSCAALPIPAVTEIGPTGDGYFALSERVPGRLLDDLDAAGMRAALPGLFATLDALRGIDASDAAGYGIWTVGGSGAAASWAQALLSVREETARVPGWQAKLAGHPAGVSAFARGYARLQELTDGLPDERSVVHGDLLNRNVLVRDTRITGVIDWGSSMYGDWVYDAAWLIFWWPWFPQWRGIDIAAEINRHWDRQGGPPPDLDRRLQACLLHIGLDSLAYNAFRGRRDDLTRVAAQVQELIQS